MRKSFRHVVWSLGLILATTAASTLAASPQTINHLLPNQSDSKTVTTPATGSSTANAIPPTLTPPAPALNARSYVIMDATTGTIIASKNMNKRYPPASLTKMMTLYLTFQALHSGQIKLDDKVRISKKAWKTGGSRMFLKLGSEVTVQHLIQGVIVASGNDACVSLADFIGGTEGTFAKLMNQTAQRLGMKNTHYVDSTGLPRPNHYSTAGDMAILAHAIIRDFPEYYHFFDEKWIDYNNIKQPNRNRLLWRNIGVDGLKTGHTKEAGYCLVASGVQNGMRLITVVMGTPSDAARNNESQSLLNYGFRFYKTYPLFTAGQVLTKKRVWMAKEKYTQLGVIQPVYVTIPRGQYKNLQASLTLYNKLKAPVQKGDTYGEIKISLGNKLIKTVPLVALNNNPKGGAWSRLSDHVALFFHGVFSRV